ncbi:hypothetical protein EMCRGX_G024248 [Ephydatia muelleri]
MAKPLGETSALLESNVSLSEPQPKAGHLPAPSASDASVLDPAVEFSYSYDFDNRRRRVQPYRRGPRFDSPEPYRRQYTTSLSPHSSNTHVSYTFDECAVCFGKSAGVDPRPCCSASVCRDCMTKIVHLAVTEGVVHITCPNTECDKALTDKEILLLIGHDTTLRNKYDRFRLDYVKDGNKKTCPRCCLITEHRLPRKFRLKESDVKLKCTSCDLEWCYKCHAPWHEGMTCRAFKTGDKQFHHWTKERRPDRIPNCQKCPLCRVYIERSTGCNHMTCRRCGSEFCYLCGEMFVPLIGYDFGLHNSKYSILGCPYDYEGSTFERVTVRGSYAAAILSSLTGYPVLFVGGVALLLVVGLVALPFYAAYKLYRISRRYRNDYDYY